MGEEKVKCSLCGADLEGKDIYEGICPKCREDKILSRPPSVKTPRPPAPPPVPAPDAAQPAPQSGPAQPKGAQPAAPEIADEPPLVLQLPAPPPSRIRHVCPGCGTVYELAGDLVGRKAQCEQCGTMSFVGPTTQGKPPTQVEAPPPPRRTGRSSDPPSPVTGRSGSTNAFAQSEFPSQSVRPRSCRPEPNSSLQGDRKTKERDFFGAKKGGVIEGAVALVLSIVGFLWAQSHAPGNISTALTGGWVLKEGPYYALMGLVLLLGVYGIVNVVRALISQQKGEHEEFSSMAAHVVGPRRTRPVWVVWAIGGGLAAICAVLALVFLPENHGASGEGPTPGNKEHHGTSPNSHSGRGDGPTSGSPYSVDFRIVSDNDYCAAVVATIKGPAAKLAVILTDPEGKSDARIIDKDDMITNCRTVQLQMREPHAGNYILSAKTVDPENTVWQRNMPLSLDQLTVGDVECRLNVKNDFMRNFVGYQLDVVTVGVKRDGTLPIHFTNAAVAVDGQQCSIIRIVSGRIMVNSGHAVGISVYCSPTPQMESRDRARGGLPWTIALFQPGERHVVRGQLFYGQANSSLAFEKEFVVPPEPRK